MKVFFGHSTGRPDVPADSPVELPHGDVLSILGGLDRRTGFLGIILEQKFTFQFLPDKSGGFEVELLDTSLPAFDNAVVDFALAEDLIKAAEQGPDVFQLARSKISEWRHLDLRTVKHRP